MNDRATFDRDIRLDEWMKFLDDNKSPDWFDMSCAPRDITHDRGWWMKTFLEMEKLGLFGSGFIEERIACRRDD